MKILYVGELGYGGTCLQRMETLRELGHEVTGIETADPRPPRSLLRRLSPLRVISRLGYKPDPVGANRAILRALGASHYDLVWIDKGVMIRPGTLREARRIRPGIKLLSYSPDDMMNPRNSSFSYRAGIPLYDLHVTTKSYNVPELTALGARRAFFVGNAYDPRTHRPIELTAEERARLGCDVGFVGAYERERAQSVLKLARAGVRVVVRGDWQAVEGAHPNLVVGGYEFLKGEDYTRAVCAARINLGFLRKVNRDLQTTRSVEIPACGAFMLAERTSEHLELFEDGKEAAFFSSDEELIERARYYLAHEDERARIAAAGRERCLRSGYSNEARITQILAFLEKGS